MRAGALSHHGEEVVGTPIYRAPFARCKRDLGGVNNILNQEVRFYVFLSGQATHFWVPDP